ncbi:NAD(P)-dependent oxidoreductase [Granulicoccus sp. GXG6511]|uniref:NAD(P)-dependent oxidoreductase n=1 Tax=Granulicoccus sp. GXG6511 TaxID=3381351 RepID=UPI003D7DC91F
MTPTQHTKVGFIGASGLMGHGMAKNLLLNGFPLAYTVNRTEPAGLDDLGATRAADNAELGRSCDVVFLCITAATDVEAALTGDRGVLTDPKAGLIIIDSSTSEPTVSTRLAEMCADKGVRFVDAPLTRGPAEAEAGTLNMLVGADADLLQEIRPLLEACAENILHAGPTGAGHTIKLLNNFVIMTQASALAEAFAVATKAGADPQMLVDILSIGIYDNKLLHLIEQTLEGNHEAMVFELDNARKDVRYYTRLAGDLGHPTVVGDAVHEALGLASALGFGSEYVPSLVKAAEKLAGTQIRRGSA